MMLYHSSFYGVPPSQTPTVFIQRRNPVLHHRQFPFHFPRRTKPPTFKTSPPGASFFDDIAPLAQNKVLIAAGAAAAIGQLFKPFASVFLYGKEFDVKDFIRAGGFPSSHSSATVASATILGLQRGLSDPIFGLTIVYAGLIMYDAQGVRREVGIHARTLNRQLLQMRVNSLSSKSRDGLINSQPGLSTSHKVEDLEKSLLSQEATSLEQQQANASLLVKSGSKIRQTDSDRKLLSSGFSAETKEISKLFADGQVPLKESIGHTELEVIAGTLLGILVGFAVHKFI